MKKPLITMKIEVLELEEVVNFIIGVQIDQLTDEELKFFRSTLEMKKCIQKQRCMYEKKLIRMAVLISNKAKFT